MYTAKKVNVNFSVKTQLKSFFEMDYFLHKIIQDIVKNFLSKYILVSLILTE